MTYWYLQNSLTEKDVIVSFKERPSHLEKDGWEIIGESPVPNSYKAALKVVTETDKETGTTKRKIVLDETLMGEEAQRIRTEHQARGQKLSAAKAQRQQEINKLKSGQLTLEQKVEVLWRLAVLDRAPSDEKAPPKEPKEPGGGQEYELRVV